jgi:Copper type II ascorbate-dependent monooxygenase, C-terminal domain
MVLNCTYRSIGQTSTVTYGESTSDEMCYAFLTFYPVNPSFGMCAQWRSLETCDNVPPKCSTNGFFNLLQAVPSVCGTSALCSTTCKLLMQAIVNTGCTSDDYVYLYSMYMQTEIQNLIALISRCGVSPNSTTALPYTTTSRVNSASRIAMETTLVLNSLLSTACVFLVLFTKSFVQKLAQ